MRARAVSRRSVLLGGAAAVGLGALTRASAAPGAGTNGRPVDLFALGVASGDPRPDGVVLWTRLAPNPLAVDGRGGMADRVVAVQWQVAQDERFSRIVGSGTELARPATAHSVHVEPDWLEPGREYFYRFRAEGEISPVGRTRTAPAPGTVGSLTMCFASCSHYGDGYFTAYRRLAEEEPELVLHLGDYLYEYPGKASDVRRVVGPETRTLAHYRQRHAQYKTDPDLRAAHAAAPWVVVWDDHETENNWADEVPERPDPDFPRRRAVAFQAYYEHLPLRSTARPHGIDMRLYRRIGWGGLATFHMLDTRQYRDPQACGGDGIRNCGERLDPNRTMTGAEQERWLLDGLRGSRARWDVLGQQVFFGRRDLVPGPDQGYSTDSWDGYRANRDRIAAALGGDGVRNGVVLTGDVHRHWAAELREDPDRPQSRAVGVELVTTSISSEGDGDGGDANAGVLADNPHLRFYKNRRGYVRTRFTADELRVDFRVLPTVRAPGAPTETAATFAVEDRDRSLHRL